KRPQHAGANGTAEAVGAPRRPVLWGAGGPCHGILRIPSISRRDVSFEEPPRAAAVPCFRRRQRCFRTAFAHRDPRPAPSAETSLVRLLRASGRGPRRSAGRDVAL